MHCADYAECLNYKCVCKKGYIGNGYERCKPLCGGKECVLYAHCEDGTCKCNSSYHGNGYVMCESNTQCGGKECCQNAVCTNYLCHCQLGYFGDGYSSCKALCGGRKCAEYARCLDGSCVCDPGYHGDALIKCEPKYFCGGRQCADNTRCVNYKCLCLDGYTGDAYEQCDALCDGRKCADYAYCENTKCVCQPAYHGDGFIKCELLGVCGGKHCAKNAECTGYHCICPHDYIGNGYLYCEKLCNGRKCALYAECTNTGCQCQPGYHGNPYLKCEVISLCGGKTCAENAQCSNYACQCKPGFIGDGIVKCQETCNGRLCVPFAECKNGNCECQENYHGFGFWKCEPHGICNGQKCATHAKCINFQCICEAGHFGDGYNSCKPFCGGGVCTEHAQCSNGTCVCHTGYHGNGYLKCEPLGICGGRECAKYAVCENFKCVCRPGYFGDGYTYCDLDGYCRGNKCADNAECINNLCVCRGGYVGDGEVACKRKCVCSASGDPHYSRYDGKTLNFQGICKYTLTKLKKTIGGCYFNIEVKNEHRGKSTRVSWTRLVDIRINEVNIRLLRRKKVLVNSYLHHLPVMENGYQIYRSGIWVVVTSRCGVTVWWNGKAAVMVEVKVDYGQHLTGICGNCNGLDDDDRKRDGEDVTGYPKRKRGAIIGHSYIVEDDTEPEGGVAEECKTEEVETPECSEEHVEAAKAVELCGLLDYSVSDSPFRQCIKQNPILADVKLKACIFDVCANYGDSSVDVQSIGCGYYEEFDEECSLRGFHVKWRTTDICPLRCPINMRYNPSVSGCPASCVNPNPSCNLPTTDGCECLPGLLESGDKCVKKEECGCQCGDLPYVPVGEQYVTEDCAEVTECRLVYGKPVMRGVQINIECGTNALCALKEGVPTCTCNAGYTREGNSTCVPIQHY
ncbi:Tenascin-X [Mizuhopecten yessoensis]|uniref:Tenascin-X n=2 Tax=Mizuhopecten yessoensis TaxID=6573 RepID=A0A210R1H0_MIZYE|nr:Tenascin-X [Mizuhopecten yessoensis]